MEQNKRKMSETELLFHSNNKVFRKIFSDHFTDKFASYLQFREWFFEVHQKCFAEIKPHFTRLMFRLYPDFKSAAHPVFQKYMNTISDGTITHLIFQAEKLCSEYKQNVNMREKYPKLEEWKKYYYNSNPPILVDDSHKKYHKRLSDEQWKEYKEKENRQIHLIHQREQKRRSQYYDIVQPILFKYLPTLNDLENDYWVIYAVTIHDNYEEWKTACDQILTTIEYKMPPESLTWKYDDWDKLQYERFLHYNKIEKSLNK